jgi:hypothetical protein
VDRRARPALAFAFSILLSAITYLGATNQALNFLERRGRSTSPSRSRSGRRPAHPAAAPTPSAASASAARSSLLLTFVARQGLVAGKLVAALSLWFGALPLTVPRGSSGTTRRRGRRSDRWARSPAAARGGLTAFGSSCERVADSNRISLGEPVHAVRPLRPDSYKGGRAARLGGRCASTR